MNRRDFLAAAATATALSTVPAAGLSSGWTSALPGGDAASDAPLPDTRWLMPVPAVRQFPGGRLALTQDFTAAFGALRNRRLDAALSRFLTRLNRRTGLALDPAARVSAAGATLVVACQAAGAAIRALGDDESYTLDVTASQVTLRSPQVLGALRGLETLRQLIEGDGQGWFLPAAHIEDRPRFAWRGLLLDVSRHWEPLEVVLRTLDGMAAVKLNVFHWHLSDDQGFRVECRRYPKLTGLGSDGNFYTQEQVRHVIAYAADRGIRVLPEFDMPAHSTSWLVGYPELGSAPGPYTIERHFGVFDNVFDPANEAVYRFLDPFFAEMGELFPDAYMHIGGDENPARQWTANPSIQAFMRAHGLADNHALQAYFNRRLAEILTRHNKKMVGWEEILNPALPDTIAVEAWLGIPAVNKIAQAGHDALLGAGYYLDLMWPASQSYAVDPIPADSPLTPEQQRHVLGGEVCMWGERVNPATVDSRIWPRTAAIAERFWSPREIADPDDMYRRLERASLDLEALGLSHRANQDRILRWLANGEDTAPLATLMETVEPRKTYGWHHSKSVFVPMVYFVNATPPESPLRRRLPAAVKQLLADRPRFTARRDDLAALFARWQAAEAGIAALAQSSPMLDEIQPLAALLRQLGALGSQALDYLAAGTPAPANWKQAQLALLEQAKPIQADLLFVVLDPLRDLVNAC
ncbi:MAG: beta-N-acetylhexosaminidase [Terriglobales bacterium]